MPRSGLDWRALHAFRETDRGAEFYFACLEYGHALWQKGFAARSLLCLDRAMGAAGLARAEREFGVERLVRSYETAYCELTAARASD